jgi:hypothetical protein
MANNNEYREQRQNSSFDVTDQEHSVHNSLDSLHPLNPQEGFHYGGFPFNNGGQPQENQNGVPPAPPPPQGDLNDPRNDPYEMLRRKEIELQRLKQQAEQARAKANLESEARTCYINKLKR